MVVPTMLLIAFEILSPVGEVVRKYTLYQHSRAQTAHEESFLTQAPSEQHCFQTKLNHTPPMFSFTIHILQIAGVVLQTVQDFGDVPLTSAHWVNHATSPEQA